MASGGEGTRSTAQAVATPQAVPLARPAAAPDAVSDVGNMAIAQHARDGGSLAGFPGAPVSNQQANRARQPLAEHSAAQTAHAVHLLPALGSPTKLATLSAGTLVAVTEVLAGGLAYRVYVPALDLTGIVPRNSIVVMPGLQHVQGAEFTRDVPEDEHPEVAQQNPALGFLAWSPTAEQPKTADELAGEAAYYEAMRGGRLDRRADEARKELSGHEAGDFKAADFDARWKTDKAALVAAAQTPNHGIKADDLYAIWTSHWGAKRDFAERTRMAIEKYEQEKDLEGFMRKMGPDAGRDRNAAMGPVWADASATETLADLLLKNGSYALELARVADADGRSLTLDELTERTREHAKLTEPWKDSVEQATIAGAGTFGRGPLPDYTSGPAKPRGPAGPITRVLRDVAARTAAVQIELQEIGAAPNTGGRSAPIAVSPAAMVEAAPARVAPAARPSPPPVAEPLAPPRVAANAPPPAAPRVAPAPAAPFAPLIGLSAPTRTEHVPEQQRSATPVPTMAEVRRWAAALARSNPDKMSPEDAAADSAAYAKRTTTVAGMYDQAMAGQIAPPSGVTKERLKLAVKGGADGKRIPLNYGADPVVARQRFQQFQRELQAVFDSEGITDAVVVQLGSGTTGWSTAPKKTGKPWAPASDADFAIFSDQALAQAKVIDAQVNPKNQLGGQYTTLKNSLKDSNRGFSQTPLGQKLKALERKWNLEIYGNANVDGFDFKLNLQTDQPFRNAVPVLQMETPIPKTSSTISGFTAAIEIQGRAPYFGVPVQTPQMASRLPVKTVGRREYHITVLSPPELAALPPDARARLANGAVIAGVPQGRSMVRKDIGDTPSFQMAVDWPEAQEFRRKLGLPPKDLHVSLNGGIGKAIAARDAQKATGDE